VGARRSEKTAMINTMVSQVSPKRTRELVKNLCEKLFMVNP
jgi:ribosomal protein L23